MDDDEDISPGSKKIRVKSILIGTAAFKFNPNQFNKGDKCVICSKSFTDDELVIRLKCDAHHYFHDSCIEFWVRKKQECPICHTPTTLDEIVVARQSIRYEKPLLDVNQTDRSSDKNLKQRLSDKLFKHMELVDEEDENFENAANRSSHQIRD